MNQFKILAGIVLGLVILILSCGKEDDEPVLNTTDFTTTIDENPGIGQSLGDISASTNQGSLTFSLTSQEPSGAFIIDASSGNLTVAEPDEFDYEFRESLSAVVNVSNGALSKTVNVLVLLNDVKASATDLNRLQRTWEMVNFSYNGVAASMFNHTCRLDDAMAFQANGTYLYNGGAELCGGEDSAQQKSGTWDLDENLNFVLFDKGTIKELRANIDFFTDTNLNMSGTYMFSSFSGETVPQ